MALSLKPTDIKAKALSGYAKFSESWFYEEPRGLLVVTQHRHNDGSWSTSQHLIPWAKIRKSLARKDGA